MWVVRLTDKQLEVVRAVLRAEEHLGPALQGALEGFDLARWDDLPEAELPWDVVASTARNSPVAGGPDGAAALALVSRSSALLSSPCAPSRFGSTPASCAIWPRWARRW